ncbi:MAG: anion permease [Clostridiales bacterium]|nr:anion permease [Clostridiales bacterium]
MEAKTNVTKLDYWVKSAIGILIMIIFHFIPGGDVITPMGMTILGIFLGTVVLWSTVGNIWPSMLALILVGLTGYAGEGSEGVTAVLTTAFGTETVLSVVFCLILFAEIGQLGFSKYISSFFLKLKVQEGRPYVFMASMMLCSYIVSGLTIPLTGMLLVFPVVSETLTNLGYKKGDKAWYAMILGVYLAAAVAQPMFPFKGACLIILGVLKTILGTDVAYAPLTLFAIAMGIIIMVIYIAFIKFIVRPDFSKLKALKVDDLKGEELPPLNINQTSYLVVMIGFIIAVMLPGFVSVTTGPIGILSSLGTIGCAAAGIVILEFVHIKNKPIFGAQEAGKSFEWSIYFLVPAAVYISGLLTDESLGIITFVKTALSPLFSGKPTIVFVILIVTLTMILTQIGANVGMAVVMMPIALIFVDEYPISPVVICLLIVFSVFIALNLPAASPYAAIMHSRKDLVSFAEIQKMYIPMLIISILVYSFIGYGILSVMF